MKNKKSLKINLVVVLLGLVFFGVNLVKAQQVLPTGGTSFETAVSLESGNYQAGELLNSTEVFYSVQVEASQKIEAKGLFVPVSNDTLISISLYNSDKEQIASSGWDNRNSPSVSLLSSSKNDTSEYYVKVSNDAIWNIKSYSLDISLVDNYDANSQTDAGDNFENALAIIAPGQYQGYLSGEEEDNHEEIDFRDFYKITVKKGQTLTIDVTPPLEARMQLSLYNIKRVLIKTIASENAGAIVSHSFDVINDGDVFAKVVCTSEYTVDTIPYGLDLAVESPGEENQVIGQIGDNSGSEELFSGEAFSFFKQLSIFSFFKSSICKWFTGGFLLLWTFPYIYFAFCLQVLAQKTKTTNAWLAWIPILNVFLMLNIAQKPLWWAVLILVPLVNIVIGIIIWMAIAQRRGKPSWWGILTIIPVIGILVPAYLAFSDEDSSKIETTEPYIATGTEAANKPTVGYKHACKYCGKMVSPNPTVCPFCGKANPTGPFRCPKCHEPVEKDWKVCPKCNQELRIVCPFCGKVTFFGDHCDNCGKRLLVTCSHCKQQQPPLGDNCIKCGKPLKTSKK